MKLKIELLIDLPYGSKKGDKLELPIDIARQLINEKRAKIYKPSSRTAKK